MKFKDFFAYSLIVIFAAAGVSCGNVKTTYLNGDKIRETILINRDNTGAVLGEGHFNVILFIKNFDSNLALIKYVNRIYHDKYKDSGLHVFLITNDINRDIPVLINKYDVSFPVLPLSKNRNILKKFIGIEDNEQALIIIDPEMKLESIYYFFKEDDIRQLFEKYMTGTITYGSNKRMDQLQAGDPFPGVAIRHIGGSVKTTIASTSELAPQLWFMFSSKCVSCALNNYLLQYKLLEGKLSGKLNISKSLLFSYFFQKEQITEQIKFYKIAAPVYLALEEIPGFESGYYKNISVDSIIVALTDRNNHIVYFESFPDFVMNFEGGHFNEMLSNL